MTDASPPACGRRLQIELPAGARELQARLSAWLEAHGTLQPDWIERGGPAGEALDRDPPLERLFRWLEHRIYGGRALPFTRAIGSRDGAADRRVTRSPADTASAPPLLLRVTVDGAPLDRLDAAVRRRIGRRGRTLPLAAWDIGGPAPQLLFRAECCLDHNSLTRSIGWTLAKVPSVIRAAAARSASAASRRADGAPAQTPKPLPASALLLDLAGRALRHLLWVDQWTLQVHAAPTAEGETLGPRRGALRPPRHHQWADPFLLHHEGRQWVLFEEIRRGAPRGHIAVAELAGDGTLAGPPTVALSEPWHLSYPFLWRENGKLYMIPESAQHRAVELYVCEGDLNRWTRCATLLEGQRWVDTTIVRFEGRLWMFCTNASNDDACMHDELHAFRADRIEGPWTPHRLNPLKIDARSARPAGKMWVQDGRLHRAVQDCSACYGGGIRVQRVDVLDDHRFEETEVAPLAWPGPGAPRPWHTINVDGEVAVIDVQGRRFRWW